MQGNLILGIAMLAICVVIQCFVVSFLLRVLSALRATRIMQPTLMATTGLLVAVILILVAGNVLQAALWAVLFIAIGEFVEFTTAMYFSLVNFTTLGYGDIVMSEQNRILGAFEAGNGILMFGLTTSVLFLVLQTAMQRVWNRRLGNAQEAGD